ncbi:dehydratase [Cnuibacter physcomitrellae]|uniref:Uncharacterized protein n=1 Tax=Cnuibacter physcomitrellae TaxID=1619308 RepID=A0A1X9LQQ4_9MICO|nr:MaoC family dehydratase [Cnuibacter physcomitrellae]ARJ07516.1 hypothetical protein B5808_19125 [Cnuibacter physcomitrellae]GGI42538.1 dehydratase [Cnuibacter physcomitrellae]
MVVLNGLDAVERAVGCELGVGSWHTIEQEAVDAFAEVTGDHQWIHVDIARAAGGPFGGTIAHGYYTLSLLPALLADAYDLQGFAMKVNYGLDRVRFPSPVRVGTSVRARATLASFETNARGARIVIRTTVEIRSNETPGCVADTVTLLVA